MNWFSRLFSQEPAPEVQSASALTLAAPAKIEFHIRRFRRAIEQCTDPERLPELQANLDYWLAIEAADKKARSR